MSFASVLSKSLSDPIFPAIMTGFTRRWRLRGCFGRFPHVVNAAEDRARISWISRLPSGRTLEVATDGKHVLRFTSDSLGPHHCVNLTGLRADTRYEYWISTNEKRIEGPFSFKTRPTNDSSEIAFFVVGDTGSTKPSQYRIASQIEKRITAEGLQFGLHTGDVCHRKPARHNEEREYFHPYGPILSQIPVWLAVGNHDIRDKQVHRPHPKHCFMPGNGRWYSIDYGPLHVVFLDSNDYTSEEQLNWLSADLCENVQKPWKFAVLHHPPYAWPYTDRRKGRNPNGSHLGIREKWCPLFERFGIQVVFCGHNHSYQRSRAIWDFGSGKGQIRYIVTGGGGARLHPIGKSEMEPEMIEFLAERHHFLQVALMEERCTIEALDDRGDAFDRFTVFRTENNAMAEKRGA